MGAVPAQLLPPTPPLCAPCLLPAIDLLPGLPSYIAFHISLVHACRATTKGAATDFGQRLGAVAEGVAERAPAAAATADEKAHEAQVTGFIVQHGVLFDLQ